MARRLFVILFAVVLAATTWARAATLPPHGPLRILVVSDEVNPHGLSPAQLTQPGDISTALTAVGSGLNLDAAPDAVLEVPTDNIGTATAALSVSIDDPAAYDVLIYFAHRIPNGPNGNQLQSDFAAAVDAFLVAGGGMISFHHGSYFASGKESILDIIGGTANGAVPWNVVDGQNVIDVAPGHFITANEVEYPSTVAYSDVPRGVPAATYSYFNNTPDERYPNFQLNPSADDIEMLFASNYNEAGTTHVLGFTHRRPAWEGVVVAYQPGEYQPNALDDLDGNNFQILANAIVYAAYVSPTDVSAPASRGIMLEQNYPNPFNPTTTIGFLLPESEAVKLTVFDVAGQHVRTLVRGVRPAGRNEVAWDGRRDDGTAVASGVYFYRLSAGSRVFTRKMLLVK